MLAISFTVIASLHVLWQFFLLFCPMPSSLHSYRMLVLTEWLTGLKWFS